MGDRADERAQASYVAEQVVRSHQSVLLGETENLRKRILKYQWYCLQDVPLDKLEKEVGSLDWNPSDTRVADYSSLEQSGMPPIVLGPKFSNGLYEVVDGMHRAAAKRKLGESYIRAYVPLTD